LCALIPNLGPDRRPSGPLGDVGGLLGQTAQGFAADVKKMRQEKRTSERGCPFSFASRTVPDLDV
jgi:hypothetical protein